MATTTPTKVTTYRDLLVWQKAMDLVEMANVIANKLPPHELFGLARQMRNAAASIPSNIAEGHGREHRGDYLRHVSIASGSLKELETHFLIAVRLKYVTQKDIDTAMQLCEELGKMIASLMQKLRR